MNRDNKRMDELEDKVRKLEVRVFDLEQEETKEIGAQRSQRHFNMWLRIAVYVIFLLIVIFGLFFIKGQGWF
ncbi:MAG: hypothetical protein GY771_00155 [bacterium]|nr:hypothetical protein [bacterium]